MVHKVKIAILRGGGNFDHEFSMNSGLAILKNLSKEKYVIYDVVISEIGEWYLNGIAVFPEKLFRQIDLVFNTVKTNGSIEKMLDDFGVKYVGSDSLASAVAGNKYLSKQIYDKGGVKTPYYNLIRKDSYDGKEILNTFRDVSAPYIVKPVLGDFSFNTFFVEDINSLKRKVEDLLEITDLVLVEEFIDGKEVVCNVVDNFRDKENYSFLPAEIVFESKIFDIQSKLNNEFSITQPRLSVREKKEIQEISIEAHKFLGLKDYSHSDFIIHPKRGIYILETNSQLNLRQDSHLLKSLEAVGLSLPEFLDHLIDQI